MNGLLLMMMMDVLLLLICLVNFFLLVDMITGPNWGNVGKVWVDGRRVGIDIAIKV